MQIQHHTNKTKYIVSLLVSLSYSQTSLAKDSVMADDINNMSEMTSETMPEQLIIPPPPSPVVKQAPKMIKPPTGLEIAQEAWERDRGFKSFSARIVMTTVKADGSQITRRLRTKTQETEVGDKSISVFDAPRDIKGVARLTYANDNGNDDQWMYITDRKRVKRISSVNDATPFMGTDFAFEDLGSQRPEEVGSFSYQYKGSESCGDDDCFVVQRTPLNPYTGYSKQIAYINKNSYRMEKIKYFDKKNKPLKILTYSGYKLFKNKYWRPRIMLMENLQTGSKTRVEWSDYRFGGDMRASEFTPANLKRVR